LEVHWAGGGQVNVGRRPSARTALNFTPRPVICHPPSRLSGAQRPSHSASGESRLVSHHQQPYLGAFYESQTAAERHLGGVSWSFVMPARRTDRDTCDQILRLAGGGSDGARLHTCISARQNTANKRPEVSRAGDDEDDDDDERIESGKQV
jgi:hypothetical protein